MNKVHQAICDIKSDLKAVALSSFNKQFKYRAVHAVYNELNPLMAKHGLHTAMSSVEMNESDKYLMILYKVTFYHADGSFFDTFHWGRSMNISDKAANICASYAHKYALMTTFSMPTEDMQEGDATPSYSPGKVIDKTVANLLAAFSSKGISKGQLEKDFLRKSVGDATKEDIEKLRKYYTSIKEG